MRGDWKDEAMRFEALDKAVMREIDKGEWVEARAVKVGDYIHHADSHWHKVTEIGKGPTTTPSLMFHFHSGVWSVVAPDALVERK